MSEASLYKTLLERDDTALVLGGGGSRGCFSIGFIYSLLKNHHQPRIVSGTSIGAIVGAIYTQETFDRLIEFVRTMEPDRIAADLPDFPENLEQVFQEHDRLIHFLVHSILPLRGADISPLRKNFRSMFDWKKFRDSPIRFGCTAFNLDTLEEEFFFKKEMTKQTAEDEILASASCYPVFPVEIMNGHRYVDGGYSDNIPVDLAWDLHAGAALVIDLEGPGVVKKDKSGRPVFTVRSLFPLQNFLDFTSQSGVISMMLGYRLAQRLEGVEEGFLYSFEKGERDLIRALNFLLQFQMELYPFSCTEEELYEAPRKCLHYHPSDASDLLEKRAPWFGLVEALGSLVQLDPLRLWTVGEFLSALLEKLQEGGDRARLEQVLRMAGEMKKRPRLAEPAWPLKEDWILALALVSLEKILRAISDFTQVEIPE